MSTRDDVAGRLGRALDGTVTSMTRLSGGASRRTSAVELLGAGGDRRALVLQQHRGAAETASGVAVQAALLRAAHDAGVPVPRVLGAGAPDGLESGWLVVERLEGATIPRRILGDPALADARARLTDDVADALARIHGLDERGVPGLPVADPFERALELLDATGEVRPVLELGARWLAAHRPAATGRTVVHGDFRMGNLLVDESGLRGVLDWELAHAGDPAEDLGWLTARAWRFGGAGEVGGFGRLDDLLARYSAASGREVDADTVRWWQGYASLKWAVICALQASAHLSGTVRSVELAAIGRRVCESEWDLLGLVGAERPLVEVGTTREAVDRPGPLGRPTARELVEAVEEYLDTVVMASSEGASRFDARVARNALRIVARELASGPQVTAEHLARIGALGFPDDAALAAAIREGALDDRLVEVASALALTAADQLRIANPSYLEASPEP